MRNVPSDFSAERYVSDALFVYSSAPRGTIVTSPRPHVEPTRVRTMIPFPPALTPPAPFPLVVRSGRPRVCRAGNPRAPTTVSTTAAGPLVVHVVSVDPHEPTVRLGAVSRTTA